jgi:class 3 adenylate cyclase
MREERCQLITVLAVRLSGLDEAAKVDILHEAQVRSTWESYSRILLEAVDQRGSILSIDPAVVAFGSDVPCEDHALRACQVALTAQQALGAWTENVKTTLGVQVTVTMGIDSGTWYAPRPHFDHHSGLTFLGPGRLALRAAFFAPPGSIVLTQQAAGFVERFVEAIPGGTLPAADRCGAMNVLQLMSLRPAEASG